MQLSEIDTAPFEPCPTPFNLTEYVLSAGQTRPDKIALAILRPTGARRMSYAALTSAVLGTATGLLRAGLTPGDLLLMRLGNTPQFPIVFLAAIATGIVPVPTSAQLTEREVRHIIHSLAPAAVVHQEGIALAASDVPVIGAPQLEAWQALPPAEILRGDPDRLAYVVYTSGTTGTPRAVGHAHRAIWARRMMFEDWYDLKESDRLMHAGAFNWTFTLGTGLLDPWAIGATALVPQDGVAITQLPLLMGRNDATLFAAAPGVVRKMLQAPLPALPRLRHGLVAGEALSDALRASWTEATGTALYEAFGMSECSTFLSARPGSLHGAGALEVQRGRRVALVSDDGRPVPRGQDGIIAVHRGDLGLMRGYLAAPDATESRFRRDWFLTGDLAVMNDEGHIRYRGRHDDMMNAGGFRVSPLEVEAALADVPGIDEIAVTALPTPGGAEIIVAAYTGPEALSLDRLSAAAAARLARYKCPRHFAHVPALPRNANGKLARAKLRTLISL